jgi:hypothetical protein
MVYPGISCLKPGSIFSSPGWFRQSLISLTLRLEPSHLIPWERNLLFEILASKKKSQNAYQWRCEHGYRFLSILVIVLGVHSHIFSIGILGKLLAASNSYRYPIARQVSVFLFWHSPLLFALIQTNFVANGNDHQHTLLTVKLRQAKTPTSYLSQSKS